MFDIVKIRFFFSDSTHWTCELLFVKSYKIRNLNMRQTTFTPFLKYVRVYRLVSRAEFFVVYAIDSFY